MGFGTSSIAAGGTAGGGSVSLTKRPRAVYTSSAQTLNAGRTILECATQVEDTLAGGTVTTVSSQWKYTANKDISILVSFFGDGSPISYGANALIRILAYVDAAEYDAWFAAVQIHAANTLNMRFKGTRQINLAAGEVLDLRWEGPATNCDWSCRITVTELN